MGMTIREFVARLRRLKATADGSSDLSAQTREAIDQLMGAFRAAYDPQQLKKAVEDGAQVSSDLEERLTTATLLLNQERARPRPHNGHHRYQHLSRITRFRLHNRANRDDRRWHDPLLARQGHHTHLHS